MSLNWNKVHEVASGGLNWEEKEVRKAAGSIECFLEATSTMQLKTPKMWSTERVPVTRTYSLVENDLMRVAATVEVLLRNLYNHTTAGRLLHQIAGLWCLRWLPIACSSASQFMKTPMSSKSDIVSVSDLFWPVHKASLIGVGQAKNQTNGASGLMPGNHTPPTPHLEASTRPLYWGVLWGMSCFTWVEQLCMRCRRLAQSLM